VSFIIPTREGVVQRRRRLLVYGPPNSGKTGSLLRTPGNRVILSFPGEKGYDTIPVDDPETRSFIWEIPDVGKPPDSDQVVADVERKTAEVIAGGEFTTFCGDGIHKLHTYILDAASGGAYFEGEDFDPKVYGAANRRLLNYLSLVCHSRMPVVIFTCWDGQEPDRKKQLGEKASDVPTHLYPELPGKAAKLIVGEFSMVLHSSFRRAKPGDQTTTAMWQTRPAGEVAGAAIKGPQAIVSRIPTFIPADYNYLSQMWEWLETNPPTKSAGGE